MILRFLLPSFIAGAIWPQQQQLLPQQQQRAWKPHPTSYLDGLRGIASVVVFFCHYTEANHRYILPTFGVNNKSQPSSLLQLPILRCIFAGRPMVHIFFIISGFALSYSPVRSVQARNLQACYKTLASSAFRRPFRLFGPCIVSTFLVMLMVQAGLIYKPLPSMSTQLWHWSDAVFHSLTWPWSWDLDLRPGYNIHLWTIPIEFVHSLLLFTVILVLSRVRLVVRLSTTVGLMVYFLACGKWAAFEFIGGMLLAEIHVWRSARHSRTIWESDPEKETSDSRWGRRPAFMALAWNGLHVAIILIAMYIGGWPNSGAEKTPGIRYLQAQTPRPFAAMGYLGQQKFWFAICALFSVWSCGELGCVRRFLERPFSQYCGRISYAIYIVHGPILAMLQGMVVGSIYVPAKGEPGDKNYKPAISASGIKGRVGVEGPLQQMICWFLGLVVLTPAVVWTADVFWRAVDMPIVALAKRVEAVCLDEEREAESSPPAGYYHPLRQG
ncbi:hypothetical protein VTK73DRAFT_7177 [Phialemonium thermophilum]|uniref:Acyltransferase 3 domain-containing protein n=1 Tax=Phialemonium thermophilum TaxID=223376 RepID=A0ABR3XTM3_9PEZI